MVTVIFRMLSVSLRWAEEASRILGLIMVKPPKSGSAGEPTRLLLERNQSALSDFPRMKTTFFNLLVGGGASNSVTKAELLQTEAISFPVFRLTHSHSPPQPLNGATAKISFSGESEI
jgi:hypothetical protein